MEIEINEYKNLKRQRVEISQGLTVLVGTNGSGKSSFLEYLFQHNSSGTCVVYSSGINESFSPRYKAHVLALHRRSLALIFEEEGASNSVLDKKFHFSKDWAPFLLLAGSYLAKEDSHLKKWMSEFHLKICQFEFQITPPYTYRRKLKTSLDALERGEAGYGFESSKIHKFLGKFVDDDNDLLVSESKILLSWGEQSFESEPARLMTNLLYDKLFNLEIFFDSNPDVDVVSNFFSMIQVLSAGGPRSRYIALDNCKVSFCNDQNQVIALNELSDGEFQILINAALLDLFDKEDSIFLLDEVDAHIHPTIIRKVWTSFEDVTGYALTTSHNLLTISNSEYNRIVFLEDGSIISESESKFKLVESICGTLFSSPVWKSLLCSVENIVLIDGQGDWEIFKVLCGQLSCPIGPLESNFLALAKSSTCQQNNRDELIKAKMIFVDEILEMVKKAKLPIELFKLKNVFFVCDSDNYLYTGMGIDLKTHHRTQGRYSIKVHSIIWNRRYIENYLISPTARLAHNQLSSDLFKWGDLDEFGEVFETTINHTNIKRVKCKSVIRGMIDSPEGFDIQKMKEYVSRMRVEEIDPYLRLVYDKIIELKSSN